MSSTSSNTLLNRSCCLVRVLHQYSKRDNDRDDPVAANKLNIKSDDKCDLGPSHCYPPFGLRVAANFDCNTLFLQFVYCLINFARLREIEIVCVDFLKLFIVFQRH